MPSQRLWARPSSAPGGKLVARVHRARSGHASPEACRDGGPFGARGGSELGCCGGAGDGNRTRMTSLEGWGSAIELRPRGGLAAPA
jgi:hypothetical protein